MIKTALFISLILSSSTTIIATPKSAQFYEGNTSSSPSDAGNSNFYLLLGKEGTYKEGYFLKSESLELVFPEEYIIQEPIGEGASIERIEPGKISVSKINDEKDASITLFFLSKDGERTIKRNLYLYEKSGFVFFDFANMGECYHKWNKYAFETGAIDEKEFRKNKLSINSDVFKDSKAFSSMPILDDWDGVDEGKQKSKANISLRSSVYTYNGLIKIQDAYGDYHGLGNITACLYGQSTANNYWECIDWESTSSYGSFSLHTPVNGYSNMAIVIYACDYHNNRFLDNSGSVYSYTLQTFPFYAGSFYSYEWYLPYSSTVNQPFWTASCVGYCYEYARYLSDGATIPKVDIVYDDGSPYAAAYYWADETIKFNKELMATIDGIKETENWDVISHEYGHRFVDFFSFGSRVGDKHNPTYSDCDVIFSNDNDPYEEKLQSARTKGLKLAWNESYPTFFGNCMQRHFSNELAGIRTCCNDIYEYPTGGTLEYAWPSYFKKTDSCEACLISFLYYLNDEEDDEYDRLHLTDKQIFTVCQSMNGGTQDNIFNKFYLRLLETTDIEGEKVATLMSHYGLVASENEFFINASTTTKSIYTSYVDNHYNYDYKRILFEIYDDNKEFKFEEKSFSLKLYFTSSLLPKIQSLEGDGFYIRAAFVYEDDPNDRYYSNLVHFYKTDIY